MNTRTKLTLIGTIFILCVSAVGIGTGLVKGLPAQHMIAIPVAIDSFGAKSAQTTAAIHDPDVMPATAPAKGATTRGSPWWIPPAISSFLQENDRKACLSHEKMIWLACQLYTNRHHGAYPPDLGTLYAQRMLRLDCAICPDSGNTIPDNIKNATLAEQAKWVNEHGDYQYYGAGRKVQDFDLNVLATEKAAHHGSDAINVIFADGHMEFLKPDAVKEQLQLNIAH